METVTIKKDDALKAYNKAKGETREVLATLIPGLDKDRWKQWTTLEDICREAGEDIEDYAIPTDATRRKRGSVLFDTLQLICDVFNMGTEISYDDPNQKKYYLWGKFVPGSGFALGVVHFAYTDTNVGARLQVESEEKARHIWAHFSHIVDAFWQGK